MEELLFQIVSRAVAPLVEEMARMREQLDAINHSRVAGKLLTSIDAGKLVGKSAATICRWCRGIVVEGVEIKLNHTRDPSGKYYIDEVDLVVFNQQVTTQRLAAAPATVKAETNELPWALTARRKRRI